MNVSREFFCPNCGRSLTMSDAMHMLALVHRGGGDYIANVTVDTVTCPGCGHAISVEEIIAGKHDHQMGAIASIFSTIGAFAIIGGLIYWIASCS